MGFREWIGFKSAACAAIATAAFTTASLIVFLSIVNATMSERDDATPANPPALKRVVMRADGRHYLEVARDGYRYDPAERSSVAFFPLYPLAAGAVARLGAPIETSLIVIANGLLLAACIALSVFALGRGGNAPAGAAGYAIAAFAVFPPSFFFHMAYAESCFIFLAVLAMFTMARRWPLAAVAAIVGLATAARPVGVALVPVFWLHVWQRAPGWRGAVLRWIALTPLALAGLVAYMGYQYEAFGDPLAFAKTQEHWRKFGQAPTGEKALALLSYEPIWSVYDSDSPGYWRFVEPQSPAWTNLAFANPLYFLLAVVLIALGASKGWLNSCETLLGALLILIPYLTRGYEMCMLSQGRFMAADFPIYLVMGHILAQIPGALAAMVIALFAVYLAVYTMHFTAGYPLI